MPHVVVAGDSKSSYISNSCFNINANLDNDAVWIISI